MGRQSHFEHSSGSSDTTTWHPLSEHLDGTGRRSASFLEEIGCSEVARAAGLLHDLGKYSKEFQDRLRGEPRRVDHPMAGAKIALERYEPYLGKLLAFCIAGHHAGLANGTGGDDVTALRDRVAQAFGLDLPALDEVWQDEITLPPAITPPPIRPRNRDGVGFN